MSNEDGQLGTKEPILDSQKGNPSVLLHADYAKLEHRIWESMTIEEQEAFLALAPIRRN